MFLLSTVSVFIFLLKHFWHSARKMSPLGEKQTYCCSFEASHSLQHRGTAMIREKDEGLGLGGEQKERDQKKIVMVR